MLLGFGSQQTRKSPLAPGDSSTPEGHGDTDEQAPPRFLCVPITALTPLSRASHIPLPEEGLEPILGRPSVGLRLTAPCDSSQLLKEQALTAPSHKHRWERVTLQLQLTNTSCRLPRRGRTMTSCIFSKPGLSPKNPWWPSHLAVPAWL